MCMFLYRLLVSSIDALMLGLFHAGSDTFRCHSVLYMTLAQQPKQDMNNPANLDRQSLASFNVTASNRDCMCMFEC